MAALFVAVASVAPANGFSSALFQETASRQITAPSREQGVEIELPDFDELFYRIRQTSPLAKLALDQSNGNEIAGKKGLEALEHIGTFPRLPLEMAVL